MMQTIRREIRKNWFWRQLTGPEFTPCSSNRKINSLVDLIHEHAPQTSAEFSKAGDRITLAKVSSPDKSITARIVYFHSYAPIDPQMINDLIPAQIDIEIHYDSDANKAYGLLAKKI